MRIQIGRYGACHFHFAIDNAMPAAEVAAKGIGNLPERPVASRAKELLIEGGAIGAMMSGSGPTTFGIFENEETRTAAAELLKENGYHPKSAESIL